MRMMNSSCKEKQKSLTQFLKSYINKHKKRVISFFSCNSVFLKTFINFLQNTLQHIIILLNNFIIKMFFTSLLNFFVLISQFILQLYYMFMFIVDAVESLMFDDKTVIDFFKQLNDLYEKHNIIKDNQKIHHFFYYCNAKHVNVMHLFFKYACKN